jgi:diadenosine tetraphosphate (Ap4A) HIT family hydrolase
VDECLVCREHRLEVPLPGGHLISTPEVVAFHLPPWPPAPDVYLGHLLATPRVHVPDFAGLSDTDASAIGRALSLLTRALKAVGAQHVYVLTIGHQVPHLHVHLVPRWPETPDEVSWRDVDTWSGARRGSFQEAEQMSEQLAGQLPA